MGTWLEVAVEANGRNRAMVAAETAIRTVEAAETRLSTWRGGTELSRVNARGETARLELSPELARDLATAIHWYRETGGAFNPGIGSLVGAWDLRGGGRLPTALELRSALDDAYLHGAEILGVVLSLPNPGLRFEEGGFGKGAALRDAARAALDNGASCVILDFGGQVVIDGHCGRTSVGIADPDEREREVARLELRRGSAATSGLSERSVVVDGIRYGHILDPRTGLPAADWGAVTVVAADPVTADILSTALYVMGPAEGAGWILNRESAEAVFAERNNGQLRFTATRGLESRLQSPGATVRYLPPRQRR